MNPRTSTGKPYPFGATVTEDGINFAVFSRNGTAVYLELFGDVASSTPTSTLALDSRRNRTGDVWHIMVHGVGHGQLYGYRVDGPYQPAEHGHRFNVHKLLTDPYARALTGEYGIQHKAIFGYDPTSDLEDLSFNTEDSAPFMPKSVAVADRPYDWADDQSPGTPLRESVFYETHVRGFTVHPSSGVKQPGSYLGLIEKIPHLKRLGVTAVELLPVHEFNLREPAGIDPVTQRPIQNYWGYSTLGFFAPEQDYAWAGRSDPLAEVVEFKDMVKALHKAGIEVILDVVFNHTGEGNHLGPTFSFRGFDNAVYYTLDRNRWYKNYSGCGNTLNCNHPVVKQFILDCLRYWVVEMHVDGFRFDLATILGRGREGEWIGDLGLLCDIGGEPILRGCKLIAEAWDAHGMYKVGGFPAAWAEWNGRFRDDVRRFVRGEPGMVPDLVRRLGGSHDLFANKHSPAHSINFVTCHDGFTLRDLVSYNRKHNARNGENNRDGTDANWSSNYGAEGPTDHPATHALRLRQAKNLLTILFAARGAPMLLGGDELWRTQEGNNNTYCQDNDLSWYNWELDAHGQEIQRFVRMLIAFRARHPSLRRPLFSDPFAKDRARLDRHGGGRIFWHGIHLGEPDWQFESHSVAMHFEGRAPAHLQGTDDCEIYAAFNAWTGPLDFTLPRLSHARWCRVIDTFLPGPDDIVDDAEAVPVKGARYLVRPRSSVVLIASPHEKTSA